MKTVKTLLLLLASVTLFFTSCKKDDDAYEIIGKWNIECKVSTHFVDGVAVDVLTKKGGWVEFKKDGKGIDSDGSEFEWTRSANTLTTTYKNGGEDVINTDKIDPYISTPKLYLMYEKKDIKDGVEYEYQRVTVLYK